VRRFVALQALFAVGLLPLLLADSLPLMTGLMLVAGLALAPVAAAGYLVVDRIAPPGTVTEATTWVMTANVAGAALGAALGGLVVQHVGVRAALLVACGGPALGTLVTLARRRTLDVSGVHAEHALVT
jgi:predicted MFS family arabinose efflux permease